MTTADDATPMTPVVKAFFDRGTALDAPHLWIEVDEPPTNELVEAYPKMFRRSDDNRLWFLDLTAYICLMHDIRRF